MTDIAVKAWVINPALRNMIVSVNGNDENGDKINVKGLVVEVTGDQMEVRNIYDPQNYHRFHLYEFGDEYGLKLEAWNSAPVTYTLPEEYLTEEGEEE